MKMRISVTTIAATSLLLGVAACSNPDNEGSKGADVGTKVKVSKDAKIAAMVPAAIREKGTFTAAVNPDVAPLKFLDSDGKVVGLSPDLLTDAGKIMGLKVEFQTTSVDALVPGLESKRFDVIAALGDFEERRAKTDFLDFLKAGTAILTSADFGKDKLTADDLCGLSIAYVRASAQQGLIDEASKTCVEAGKEAMSGSPYGDANAGILAVKSGRNEGFWGDSLAMAYNADKNPKLYKVVFQENTAVYGIGVNKENAKFRDALQAALLDLVRTGAYDQTLKKWAQAENKVSDIPLNSGGSLNDL